MSRLVWDQTGERRYETGVRNGVLYVYDATANSNVGGYGTGVAWNGLTGVTVSPEGADATDLYADDIKYLTMRSAENVKATIEAYTYPDEWATCDGSAAPTAGVKIGQQPRSMFGFVWQTVIGNDTSMDGYGKMLHILWGCTASPSEKAYQTINDSPEAITFSWEISSNAVPYGDGQTYKPTAYMEIDSTKLSAAKWTAVEDLLFGSANASPTLPVNPKTIVDTITAAT